MMVDVPGAAPVAPATKKARGATKQAPDHSKSDDHPKPGGNGKDKDRKSPQKGGDIPAALGLGWRMQQLYAGAVKQPERDRDPAERLRGLGSLTRWQRFELRLDQVEFLLARVDADINFPTAIPAPSTSATRAALAALARSGADHQTALAAEALRGAVADLHEDLLIKLNGADSRLGTAYGLGRALADTCRPNQTEADLNDGFRPDRLAQLYEYLSDLASALPDHAAKAVRQSLTWWRDAAYRDGRVTNADGQQLLASVRSTSPGLMARRQFRARLRRANWSGVTLTSATALAPTGFDHGRFVATLRRQGEIWRNVLTGDKAATDLLETEDYVVAARSGLSDAWRLLRTRSIIVPLLLILAGLGGLAYVIVTLNASGGSKIGGALGAAVTFLVAVGRTMGPRAKLLADKIEQPLWGAELDLAIAEALTLPPAGAADPGGWASLASGASTPVGGT